MRVAQTARAAGTSEKNKATTHEMSGEGSSKDSTSPIAAFVSLMTQVFPGRCEHATIEPSSKDLKEQLAAPISALPANANREDVACAASYFLARKVLPTAVDKDQLIIDYISKMGSDQTANASFVTFSTSKVAEIFPIGWDSRYVSYCGRALPTDGSSFGTSRNKGGSREEIKSRMSREDFQFACLTGQGISIGPDRKVTLIDDNGKVRIVTIAEAIQHVLGPLHHLLYDFLSSKEWLLRGDATANSFKGFTKCSGKVFVSGDYESATDNFNRHHSEAILRAVFARCRSIPKAIQELALQSLSGNIIVDGVSYPQIAGQLMGNLLSFPLLCLTNYLAFKYSIPQHVPLRINGDDIVFQCTPEQAAFWIENVKVSGLTLSMGKTLIHARFFSLNSTFFEARAPKGNGALRVPSLIPVIRAKSIYSVLIRGDSQSLASRLWSSCKGMTGWRKGLVRGHILKYHRNAVKGLGCSLNRALGIRVTHDALVISGLLEQEVHYLSAPAGVDIPREKLDRHAGTRPAPATQGWVKVNSAGLSRTVVRHLNEKWGDHCLQHAWTVKYVPAGKIDFKPPIYGFKALVLDGRKARLARISLRGLKRLVRSAWRRVPSVKDWLYGKARRRSSTETVFVRETESKFYTVGPRFVAARSKL